MSCQVTNTGSRAGTEVVQLYLRDEQACMVRPVQELVGFARVALEPGESRQVCFTFRPDRMAFLNREMRWLVEKGDDRCADRRFLGGHPFTRRIPHSGKRHHPGAGTLFLCKD